MKTYLVPYLILCSFIFSITNEDLTARIIIDGNSSDFTSDEEILSNSDGELLESPRDSYWGENNDIRQIKATWDEKYFYVAVDACSWDNNVMLFIDIHNDYGISDMSNLNAWARSFKFYNINPDFFVGTWDTNNSPQFWSVREGGSMQADLDQSIESFASFNTGELDKSMEVKIPWTVLKGSGQNITTIKLVSVITGGGEYTSSPDSAPDNLGGMTNNASQTVVIDNYAEIEVDSDEDGYPDMGVNPQSKRSFFKQPPFESLDLKIQDVVFQNGKTFSPYQLEVIEFSLETNRSIEFRVKVFDLNGRYITDAEKEDSASNQWKWNGKNNSGVVVPFGVYILLFESDSGEASHKESIVVI